MESSRLDFERGVEKLKQDIRRWTACLTVSRWMPVQIIEEWSDEKGLCFPLVMIQVNNKGKK